MQTKLLQEDLYMKIFFVDSENVGCQGLRGMTELSKDDIIYFLTNLTFQECTVPLSFAFALKASPARFFNVPLNTRRISQYLDRVLGTLLGHALALYPEAEAVIVSRDKGYLPEIEYWQSQGRTVSQFPSICDCLRSPHAPSTLPENAKIDEWQDITPETPQKEDEAGFAQEKCDDFKQEQEETEEVSVSEGTPAGEKCDVSQKSPAKRRNGTANTKKHNPSDTKGGQKPSDLPLIEKPPGTPPVRKEVERVLRKAGKSQSQASTLTVEVMCIGSVKRLRRFCRKKFNDEDGHIFRQLRKARFAA